MYLCNRNSLSSSSFSHYLDSAAIIAALERKESPEVVCKGITLCTDLVCKLNSVTPGVPGITRAEKLERVRAMKPVTDDALTLRQNAGNEKEEIVEFHSYWCNISLTS